jgi:hypothetical protein
MLEKIQTLSDSWEDNKADYLEDYPEDKARAEHLADWAGDHSSEVWKYFQKKDGILWQLPYDVIEDRLIKAGGDVDLAVDLIYAYLKEDDPGYDVRSEALTAAERNPSLVGV